MRCRAAPDRTNDFVPFDRVQNPPVARRTLGGTELLAEHGVVREVRGQRFPHVGLDFQVGLRDRGSVGLLVDPKVGLFEPVFGQSAASVAISTATSARAERKLFTGILCGVDHFWFLNHR